MQILTGKATELQTWITSLERAFLLLDQEPEIAEEKGAVKIQNVRGDFEFKNVSFAYDESGRGLEESLSGFLRAPEWELWAQPARETRC